MHVSLNRWLSKLASTFVRAFVEEKLTLLNSLKLACISMLAFHCWIWLRWVTNDLQSLLASSSTLSSKKVLCHCIASNFLHRLSWRFWRIDANRLKKVLMLTERLQDDLFGRAKTGGLGQVTTKKKGITRPRPDGGVKIIIMKKKTGITRPRPDRGVESPRGIKPAVVVPPLGCRIYYGHPRYKP